MAEITVDTFLRDFAKELCEHNAAIFAGAGLSVPAGFVDWKGLLRPLAEELELDVERETDLVKIAQYHVNHHEKNRTDLSEAILNGFSQRTATVTENHKILARLPINTYWTTNYDHTIENALRAGGKLPHVKHSADQLAHTLHGRDAVVYKMHGDKDNAEHAVLCKEDYETYHLTRGDFLTALAGDLLTKTFLFIGFSFSDPNLDYVLGRMLSKRGANLHKHFCFVKREEPHGARGDDDYGYRQAKQKVFIKDLGRYNIRPVLIDRYEDVTKILRLLETQYKSRTVFTSGAAHDYGTRFSADEALGFVHKLSALMVQRGFRIVTGLGLGIGSAVVDGALQEIYHVQRRALKDELIIRPFPQGQHAKSLWRSYREDMLDFAGIAIFMFGNKLDGRPPVAVEASGVLEEFEIAHKKGIKVLPLGFTEFVARQLYERVQADFPAYHPKATLAFRQQFALLGDPNRALDQQLQTVVDALMELQRAQ